MEEQNAIEFKHVTKRFGDVTANYNINMSVRRGEILSVLGENGSGKTTLMNILAGIYFPDNGQVFVNGKEVVIRSPKDSFALGIGMIHQHFKLISTLTAAENIILGLKGSQHLDMKKISSQIGEIASEYGFVIDPDEKIYDMSVAQKQTVEILKVLYRKANILILDEPTAVLTPQETEKLFNILRNMRSAGKSIIIITHKLNEVLELSDRVAVLRKGEYIGTIPTEDATISSLTAMMVGKKVELNIKRTDPVEPHVKLEVRGLNVRNKENLHVVKNVSFKARSGEILGIAGISGNGQKELLEAIAGLHKIENGEVFYYPDSDDNSNAEPIKISELDTSEIRKLGVLLSFVPEDRLGMGVVGSMNVTENMMLRIYRSGKGFFTDRKKPKDLAESIVDKLDVDTPGIDTPVGRLSGGNVQKVLLGREIALKPKVLMVAYPVRGLDINSSYVIYNLLNEQKEKGVAVICVGEDLDVLIDLCDRIMVLSGGEEAGIVNARETSKEELGLMMTGGKI